MKRHLKPQVQNALTGALIIMLMLTGSVNDFTVEGLPVFLVMVGITALIGAILGKWGKF